MSQSSNDIDRVRARLERFQLSNADLRQQLSDSLARSQRLASSLGFRDIYDAQASIDTADQDLSYRQCLKELERVKAQRDSALERLRELEEQSRASPVSDDRCHFSNWVADDIAVDVLPFALRLAHYEVSGLRQSDVDELPAEGTIKMYELIGQWRETLQRNAKIVRKWENMFNFHEKDRKSKASRLTPWESFRFQRALYRIMLVCRLYGMDSIPASDMQDEDYPYQARQTKFLSGFPTDDVFEINRVIRFLHFISSCTMVRDPRFGHRRYFYDWEGLYLFAGPTFTMNQHRDREKDNDIHSLKVSGTRHDDPRFQDKILNSAMEGTEDLCIRCQLQEDGQIFLRNESSWDFMKFSDILMDLSDKLSSIIGQTGLQYSATGLFSNQVRKTSSKQLMEELLELRQAKYISWNREDWACTNCWVELIVDTFPTWWAKRYPQQMDGKD